MIQTTNNHIENSFPDRCIEYFKRMGIFFKINDYSETIYESEYFCYHIFTESFDGIGTDKDPYKAASKACAELLERIHFKSPSVSMGFFGSAFQKTKELSTQLAIDELVERTLFNEFLKNNSLSLESTDTAYLDAPYTLYVCSNKKKNALGVGFSIHSKTKASLESKRRLTIHNIFGSSDSYESVHSNKLTKLQSLLKNLKLETYKISTLGYASKAYWDTDYNYHNFLDLFSRSKN